jgi:hypothetical protein
VLRQVLFGGWPGGLDDAGPNRYGKAAAEWVCIDEKSTLGAVLRKGDYVAPGIPVFWLVPKDSDYTERMLASDLPTL